MAEIYSRGPVSAYINANCLETPEYKVGLVIYYWKSFLNNTVIFYIVELRLESSCTTLALQRQQITPFSSMVGVPMKMVSTTGSRATVGELTGAPIASFLLNYYMLKYFCM